MALELQLLVLQLAFELFRLCYLPYRLVEVILVDRVAVVLDREEATVASCQLIPSHFGRLHLRFSNNVP